MYPVMVKCEYAEPVKDGVVSCGLLHDTLGFRVSLKDDYCAKCSRAIDDKRLALFIKHAPKEAPTSEGPALRYAVKGKIKTYTVEPCEYRGEVIEVQDRPCCHGMTLRTETFACSRPEVGGQALSISCQQCRYRIATGTASTAAKVKAKPKDSAFEKHADAMLAVKDLWKGRRAFLLATGPSVAEQDISWLGGELVVGINFAHKITLPQGWVPQYMLTADSKVMGKLADEYERLGDRTRIVCSDTVISQSKYANANLLSQRGISIFYKDGAYEWDCVNGVRVQKAWSTTGHLALPFILWLGCDPIYLLGCDCTARGHAYDDKGVVCPGAGDYMKKHFMPAMATARKCAEKAGRRIVNATRGGLLEEFERVDLDSLRRK